MPFEKDQFTSRRGWSSIRFGDSPESVRTQLRAAEIDWEEGFDKFHWQVGDNEAELFFAADSSKQPERVVQIIVGRDTAQIDGHEIVGLKLDEALLELNVQSFSDTIWSIVDIDSEYDNGKPIDDAERTTQAEPLELLESGTLWIKSLGIGLILDCGEVESVVLRSPTDVPKVGCGPLDKEAVGRVGDEKLRERIESRKRATKAARSSSAAPFFPSIAGTPRSFIPLWLKITLTLAAAVMMILPIYWFVEAQLAWQKAEKIIGVVVETRPEGPFPEIIVVEYKQPDAPVGRVELKFNYTTARAVGDEVELLYLRRDPSRVMTRNQAVDEVVNFSPMVFFATLPLGYFILMMLYPKTFLSSRRK